MKSFCKKISVVVPIYNVKNYIKSCLLSIIQQTYTNLEIILVNDGSTDDFLYEIQNIINDDNRISLFEKPNGGLSSARNYGINKSTGDYIVFIDSDDTVDPNFIEILYKNLIETESDIAICGMKILDYSYGETYTATDVAPTDFLVRKTFDKFSLWDAFYYHNKEHSYGITVAWNKLYKRSLFKKVRFEEGKIFEDEYFTYKIFDLCNKIVVIPDALYFYKRNRSGSIMSLYQDREKKFLVPIIKRHIYFIKNGFTKNICLLKMDKFIYSYYHNFDRKEHEFNKLVWRYYLYIIFKINISYIFKKHFIRLFLAPFKKKKRIDRVVQKKQFPQNVLIGTPEHGNLGDHAIAIATVKYLKSLNVPFTEISYNSYYKNRQNLIDSSPRTIFLQGGGNMGNNWINEEKLRWDVILSFPNSNIIIFPQTIFFEDNYGSETCKETIKRVYNSHKNLIVFARENYSYKLLKGMGIKVLTAPDMVLYNEPTVHCISNEKNVLIISRKDKETNSISKEKMINLVDALKAKGFKITSIDTVLNNDVKIDARNEKVSQIIQQISQFNLVITDRLHGMIFSYITSTPAIVFGNYNYKITGTYDIIKNRNVFYSDDKSITQILGFVNSIFEESRIIQNDSLNAKFDCLEKVIKDYGKKEEIY